MLPFALAGMLIGAVLGTRLTVLALIPAMMGGLVLAGAIAITRELAFGATIIDLALVLASVQVGYFGGAAARLWFDPIGGRWLRTLMRTRNARAPLPDRSRNPGVRP